MGVCGPERQGRVRARGRTLIEGAGDSWSHSHRPSPYERTAAEDVAAGDDDDDVNELPWQVIYIGDRNMVWNLVNQRRHHERGDPQRYRR